MEEKIGWNRLRRSILEEVAVSRASKLGNAVSR